MYHFSWGDDIQEWLENVITIHWTINSLFNVCSLTDELCYLFSLMFATLYLTTIVVQNQITYIFGTSLILCFLYLLFVHFLQYSLMTHTIFSISSIASMISISTISILVRILVFCHVGSNTDKTDIFWLVMDMLVKCSECVKLQVKKYFQACIFLFERCACLAMTSSKM